MADKKDVDVLIPLDSVSGSIWDKGWRGHIHYVPITDYSVPPKDVAMYEGKQIADWIASGKKVGMFCIGGHGRTGTLGAIILWYLGVEDPIKKMRDYCENTLETQEQIDLVSDLAEKPEWKDLYEGAKDFGTGWGTFAYGGGGKKDKGKKKKEKDYYDDADIYEEYDYSMKDLNERDLFEDRFCIDCPEFMEGDKKYECKYLKYCMMVPEETEDSLVDDMTDELDRLLDKWAEEDEDSKGGDVRLSQQ